MMPPATSVGDVRFVVVLSPSCPVLLRPQQYIAPVGVIAHACCAPIATSVNVRAPAETIVGVVCTVPCAPSPKRPDPAHPQQYRKPVEVSPHEAVAPVVTLVNAGAP